MVNQFLIEKYPLIDNLAQMKFSDQILFSHMHL